MKRAFTWQALIIVVVAVLLAAASAFMNGYSGLAIALLVVAASEALFWGVMAYRRCKTA
jgi:hypothetical protein